MWKSTFLRELAFKQRPFSYRTLDNAALRRQAQQSPELFLSSVESFPLVFDEAQKAPDSYFTRTAMSALSNYANSKCIVYSATDTPD